MKVPESVKNRFKLMEVSTRGRNAMTQRLRLVAQKSAFVCVNQKMFIARLIVLLAVLALTSAFAPQGTRDMDHDGQEVAKLCQAPSIARSCDPWYF